MTDINYKITYVAKNELDMPFTSDFELLIELLEDVYKEQKSVELDEMIMMLKNIEKFTTSDATGLIEIIEEYVRKHKPSIHEMVSRLLRSVKQLLEI
jgi:hypothetical protein